MTPHQGPPPLRCQRCCATSTVHDDPRKDIPGPGTDNEQKLGSTARRRPGGSGGDGEGRPAVEESSDPAGGVGGPSCDGPVGEAGDDPARGLEVVVLAAVAFELVAPAAVGRSTVVARAAPTASRTSSGWVMPRSSSERSGGVHEVPWWVTARRSRRSSGRWNMTPSSLRVVSSSRPVRWTRSSSAPAAAAVRIRPGGPASSTDATRLRRYAAERWEAIVPGAARSAAVMRRRSVGSVPTRRTTWGWTGTSRPLSIARCHALLLIEVWSRRR